MAEISASPIRSKSLKRIAEVLADLQGPMGQVIPGTDINPFKLLPAASSVENWAYGNLPMAMPPSGTGGYIPIVKTGRKGEMVDLAGTVLGVAPAVKAAERGTEALSTAAVRAITGNPNATPMGVIEEAGNMVPLNRIFIPARDEQALAMAKYLEERGMRPEDIWKRTGIGRLPAGRDYVQEISDARSTVNPAALPTDEGLINSVPLSEVYKNPDLAAADFSAMAPIRIGPETRGAEGVRGTYNPSNFYMTVLPEDSPFAKSALLSTAGRFTPEDMRSVITHELQHAYQFGAGQGLGGNPGSARQMLELASRQDPAFSPAATQAHYEWKQAIKQRGMASRAEYFNKLQEYSQRENLKPSMVLNMQDWYAYGHDYRGMAGPMPKKPGPARDRWLQGAARHMLDQNLKKEPWYGGLMEEFDKKTARNTQARADRVIKKHSKVAREFEEAASKYRNLASMSRDEKGNLKPGGDYKLYQRLEGEAIARLAQNRMNLSDIERRANYPFHSMYERTMYENNQPVRKEIFNPYGLDVQPDEIFAYRETK